MTKRIVAISVAMGGIVLIASLSPAMDDAPATAPTTAPATVPTTAPVLVGGNPMTGPPSTQPAPSFQAPVSGSGTSEGKRPVDVQIGGSIGPTTGDRRLHGAKPLPRATTAPLGPINEGGK